MPGCAVLARQTVAIDVGPGRDELPIKALRIEPGYSLRGRLDELWKERPHLEAIGKFQRRSGTHVVDYTDAHIGAPCARRSNQALGNVVSMDVDGHFPISGLLFSRRG